MAMSQPSPDGYAASASGSTGVLHVIADERRPAVIKLVKHSTRRLVKNVVAVLKSLSSIAISIEITLPRVIIS
jgi:hypothetical protein